MTACLTRAKALLTERDCTCVLCSEAETILTQERGIRPLLLWLDEGRSLADFAAADKVVGKAAACLYVLLSVGMLYTRVISRPALAVLEAHGIAVQYDTLTEAIRNRAGTGFCPMETAVRDASSPGDALENIRTTLAALG